MKNDLYFLLFFQTFIRTTKMKSFFKVRTTYLDQVHVRKQKRKLHLHHLECANFLQQNLLDLEC